MAKQSEKVFFCGRRFELDEDGHLIPLTQSEKTCRGKYGEKSVVVRVPVSLLPWLQSILKSIEEIETVRRNIEANLLNTSPELIRFHALKNQHDEDWRRAVAYGMRPSAAVQKRKEQKGTSVPQNSPEKDKLERTALPDV